MGARVAPEQGEDVESGKGAAKASAQGEWPWKKVGQTSQGGGRETKAGSGRGKRGAEWRVVSKAERSGERCGRPCHR